jgi:hypothetical protein
MDSKQDMYVDDGEAPRRQAPAGSGTAIIDSESGGYKKREEMLKTAMQCTLLVCIARTLPPQTSLRPALLTQTRDNAFQAHLSMAAAILLDVVASRGMSCSPGMTST